MKKEEWKQIPNYEGLYEVSSLGRVKSLIYRNEKIKKSTLEKQGYLATNLSNNGFRKTFRVHQLVAMAFLNHTPDGNNLVVDHINDNKLDNRVENLQMITNGENIRKGKKRINTTSKYKNVCWNKKNNNWRSYIRINGKLFALGSFNCELSASIAYQNKLKTL